MFSKFDNVDFKRMADFCIEQDGMIIRKDIEKCDSHSSSSCKSKAVSAAQSIRLASSVSRKPSSAQVIPETRTIE